MGPHCQRLASNAINHAVGEPAVHRAGRMSGMNRKSSGTRKDARNTSATSNPPHITDNSNVGLREHNLDRSESFIRYETAVATGRRVDSAFQGRPRDAPTGVIPAKALLRCHLRCRSRTYRVLESPSAVMRSVHRPFLPRRRRQQCRLPANKRA